MGTWKAIQLGCMFITWIMSPLFQLANKKFSDHSKRGHSALFWTLITVWLVAGGGLALATYKDFSKKPKAPALLPMVNGVPIENNGYITAFTTNSDSVQVEFRVANVGDWSADSESVSVHFPAGLTVTPSGTWKEVGSASDMYFTNIAGSAFVIATDRAISPPSGVEVFPVLTVRSSNLVRTINRIIIQVDSKNSPRLEATFFLHFTNGTSIARKGL